MCFCLFPGVDVSFSSKVCEWIVVLWKCMCSVLCADFSGHPSQNSCRACWCALSGVMW